MSSGVLKGAYRGMLKGIEFLIAILAAILVVVVFSNVICRYFLQFALAWAEETARFLFIWLSFLGAILANAYSEHMNFDFLVGKLPRKLGLIVTITANIVVLIVLYFIFKGGIKLVTVNIEWMTPALNIPYGLVYSIVPISAVVLALQFLTRTYGSIVTLLGLPRVEYGKEA